MKSLCLLAVVAASVTGCASMPESESKPASDNQAVSVAKPPTGTVIARNPGEKGAAPLTEANKQALENERLMNSWKR